MQDSLIYEGITLQKHMLRSFLWMFVGLLVTALTAFLMIITGMHVEVLIALYTTHDLLILLPLGIQLGIAVYLGTRLLKMSSLTTKVLYIVYSMITGITFSVFPIFYGSMLIAYAFGFTSILFVSLVFIGYSMKLDLTKYSTLLSGALITLLVASVIGFFVNLGALDMIICYAGILLFLILTAYDIQVLKRNYAIAQSDETLLEKLSIYSAFQLYLNFINIFMFILRLLSKRK